MSQFEQVPASLAEFYAQLFTSIFWTDSQVAVYSDKLVEMKNTALKIEAAPLARPDVYAFHDYREFMRELLVFLKHTQRLSTRKIARESGVAESYISMIVSGVRTLSGEHLAKLAPVLGLDRSEVSFIEHLIEIDGAENSAERFEALKKIQRFRGYQTSNPAEIEIFKYLEHWYHVAIRELAQLPGFQPDPKWIQKALRYKVGLTEIKEAVDFLLAHGFLEMGATGKVVSTGKLVQCKTGVLKPALIKFHSEMLELAVTSLTEVPNPERNVSAFTGGIPVAKLDEARAILDEARRKIVALSNSSSMEQDTVYHFGFLAFPLSNKMEEE